jgi:D-alanyl-D-alanine carboxypeptidase
LCWGLVALAAFAAAPAMAGPYILVDATTGRVIAQHDAGHPWYPASITKLMTTFVAFRAMREGRVTADTLLTVSERAYVQAPTKMGFPLGTQVTLDNALKMLMVKSANDMAVSIAEGVGGTYENFIEEMNRTAAELGMTATHYNNPNGLPDDGQVTSARDMAILARAIYREFPEQEMMFRIPALRLGKRLIRNHNKLIDHYPGADGMKTGFICAGGFNIVASAKRGDKRLIVVVLGGRSNGSRNDDAAKLFEKGFSRLAAIGAVFRGEPRTIEAVQNVQVDPVDMHDLTCGRGRRKVPIESDVEDDDQPEDGDIAAADASAIKDSAIKDPKAKKPKSYFVDLPPSMQPIRVFIGSPAQSDAQKFTSGDELIPRAVKKNKKGKKSQVVIRLPRDEQIAPTSASAQGGPLIPFPTAQPAAQSPQAPVLSAAERAVMSEGAPLDRDRKSKEAAKPKVLDPAPGSVPEAAQAFASPGRAASGENMFVPAIPPQPPLELPATPPATASNK